MNATTSGPQLPWTEDPHRTGEPMQVQLPLPGASCRAAVWRYRPTRSPGAAPHSGRRLPRLLMIHGFRGDHHGMQLVVDALAEFEVFVPDLPGFGATPAVVDAAGRPVEHSVQLYAQVVAALADALELGEEDVLTGHSFGTIITSAHAAQSPSRWAGLVLSAPISNSVFSGTQLPGAAVVELYYQLSRLLPARAADALLRSQTVMEVTNLTMGVEWDAPLAAFVRDQHRRYFGGYADRATLLQAYRASSRHTVADYAEGLQLPVLLLPGAKDQLSSPQGRRRLLARLPQGRMETLRGTGHLVHYEKPAQLARAVRRFIAQLG